MNDLQRTADALACIPSIERETWVRMAMAVKAEHGDAGFSIWDEWSRHDEKYKADHAKAVWRSVKATGGIGPGSLYVLATQWGWGGEPPVIDPEVESKRRRQRAAEAAAEERRQREQWDAAARRAQAMIRKAYPAFHPYLDRKGFREEQGLVLDSDLLIPMRETVDARLVQSVQMIKPDGSKKFLPGGRARGSSFVLGTGAESWLCEGFATALSARAALRALYRPARIVVCFSAANLAHVAALIKGARYVIADNDSSGTGQNYALKTQLPWWMPPAVDTDANDFHRTHGIRALAHELNELRRQ